MEKFERVTDGWFADFVDTRLNPVVLPGFEMITVRLRSDDSVDFRV